MQVCLVTLGQDREGTVYGATVICGRQEKLEI